MIFFRLLKNCLTKKMFILFISVQISACGTEEFLASIAPEIGSATEINTDGTNHAAIISGVDSGSVIEDVDPDGDSLLEVSGKLNITDSDTGEQAFIATVVIGNYGSLDIDTAGNWNYAASNQQVDIQNLTDNASLTENLIVSSVDGTLHTVEISIIGVIDSIINTNNAAVFTGDDSGSVTEDLDGNGDGLLDASGKLNITDSDAGEAAFIVTTINGNYGNLDIDISGNWFYGAFNNRPAIQNLNSGATLIDNLTISSVDGTAHTIVITIRGVNEANQVAMYSYNANLSDAQPLSGAVLDQSTVYMFFTNTSQYSSMNFYCCKEIDGTSTGEAHKTPVRNSSAPFIHFVDLSQDSTTGTRELYVDATRTYDSGLDSIFVNFSINISITPITPSPAVISGVNTGSVTEDIDPDNDNLLEIDGKLNITDSDAGEAAFIEIAHNGNHGDYGQLVISAEGNWRYYVDNNQTVIQNLVSGATLTDNLTVRSIDGTAHKVVITIQGANESSNTVADVSLSWVAPAEREDNSGISLSEIAGYKIYYGTSQGQYPNKITINDGTAVGHTFTDFHAGNYYFVVTTLDTNGRESRYSTEVVITI